MTTVTEKITQFKSWLETAGLQEKKHQISGMKFCLSRECEKNPKYGVRGGIIADEMGLGKTILMLGCINCNFRDDVADAAAASGGAAGEGGKFNTLVVLPLALLAQWKKIFEKFMGHTPLVYHGSKIKEISNDELSAAPVVLTTYGMIATKAAVRGRRPAARRHSPLWDIHWNRLVMDEAHHVRNQETGIFLGAKKIKANIRWMVTGTPIQNKQTDFHSLCSILGLDDAFLHNMESIKDIIRYHLLRRTKTGVGIKLPPLNDIVITVPWASAEEETLARQIHSQASFSEVYVENVDQVIEMLTEKTLPTMVRARQACIFPHLLTDGLKRLQQKGVLGYDFNLKKVKTCSKMTAIAKHLTERKQNKLRKIVFCHYRGEIDLLCRLLNVGGVTCERIDGRTRKKDREMTLMYGVGHREFSLVSRKWKEVADKGIFGTIDAFLSPSVIAVQIQTASEGLNLQHFQEIYFSSPHFNPAVEMQAIARAHRIGQLEKVNVFRFVMKEFSDPLKDDEGSDEERDDSDAEVEEESGGMTLDQYCIKVQNYKRQLMEIVTGHETTDSDISKNTKPKVIEEDKELVAEKEGCGNCNECCICLEKAEQKETTWLPCSHSFHTSCIQKWLKVKPECPVCRNPVDVE
jgi:SNF2 family DNA or RNA helicase